MSHKLLIVISVYNLIFGVAPDSGLGSFLDQQSHTDEYGFNNNKRLKRDAIWKKLPDDPTPQGQHGRGLINDYVLDDDDQLQNLGPVVESDVSNDHVPENYHTPPKDTSYGMMTSTRDFSPPLDIPFILVPIPGLIKCLSCAKCGSSSYQPLSVSSRTAKTRKTTTPKSKFQVVTTNSPPSDPIDIIKTLTAIHQIRDNILFIFGCLLQRPTNFLTEPQYTALYSIFIELRNRPSMMQFLMPHSKTIPIFNLTLQLIKTLQILSDVLPPHLSCSARFLIMELQQRRIDLDSLSHSTCSKYSNILQGVKVDNIRYQTAMKPFDTATLMTEIVLGPVFVKILNDVQKLDVPLPQELFGIILANFPLIPYDPVLDENIRFIFEIMKRKQIVSWEEIGMKPVVSEPYQFIRDIIARILEFPNVPQRIEEALSYINIHLIPIAVTHANPDYQIMHRINKKKLDLELLLSFVVPGSFDNGTICLKNRLLGYIQQGRIHPRWMITESEGLRYTNPQDLLLAFLAKLQKKITNQSNEIARTTTALLSGLLMDKQNKKFGPGQQFDIFTILGYFNNPEFQSKVIRFHDEAMKTLVSKPDLQILLTKLASIQEGRCFFSKSCLRGVFSKLIQENLRIPKQGERIITELNEIIPVKSVDSECGDSASTPGYIVKSGDSKSIDNATFKSSGISERNAKLMHVLMLPPMLHANQEITIYISDKGAPILDSPDISNFPGYPKVTMPPLMVILKPPELIDPFRSMNSDFRTRILEPLISMIGSDDLTTIIGTNVEDLITSNKLPTTAALMVTLLEKAKSNHLVQMNQQLVVAIKTFLSGMDLFAMITLPVVMRVAKINPINGFFYSIISLSEPHRSMVSVTPPVDIPLGMLVFAVVDPEKLRKPVDPMDPYSDLLPNVGRDAVGGLYIQQLKMIFTKKSIGQLLPNFEPEGYTNKGFLLMVILQKLPNVPAILAKPHLRKIIIGYIWAIIIPAYFTKVSYNDVLRLIDEQPEVKPDTSFLFELLPPPEDNWERRLLIVMQQLLEREDLFDILTISKPSSNTSRMELLKMIIEGVLRSKDGFDRLTVTACKHFNSRVFDIKKDSLPIAWEMREVEVTKFKIHLGQLIEDVILYDELSKKEKKVYNKLMEYLRENSKIFSLIDNFPFGKYETQGTFIQGVFKFLLRKSIITEDAKDYIRILLPRVILNGPGAKLLGIPKPLSGRRNVDKLEIVY